MSSFLDRFTPDQRRQFEAVASTVQVQKGQRLLRRGEPGGDLYLLRKGSFEVVDTRSTPEVILAVFEEGAMVGEMSFVDDSPRSADVRAASDGEALRWARDDLRSLLQRNPVLAATFYEGLARLAAVRSRALATNAMSGALTRQDPSNAAGLARVRDEARRIADAAKEAFLEIDMQLHQDPNDEDVRQRLVGTLDKLQEEARQIVSGNAEPEVVATASRLLGRELQPYLVRSALAERCIRRPEGVGGAADVLAHVLLDTAGGDGQLGELIDRWLLDRPMLQALRAFRQPVTELAASLLPKHRNRRVAVFNAATGSLVTALAATVATAPTTIAVLDHSREALAYLDAGVVPRGKVIELRPVLLDLAAFATHRASVELSAQDVAIVHGLVEYMPERIAVALLEQVQRMLAPGGHVIVCALCPSDDQDLFDQLLGWPTVRRSAEGMRRILVSSGFEPMAAPELPEPAMVAVGRVAGR